MIFDDAGTESGAVPASCIRSGSCIRSVETVEAHDSTRQSGIIKDIVS